MPARKISLSRRLSVAWDALWRGKVSYTVPVKVTIRMEKPIICPEDLVNIKESVHMGVFDALEEQQKSEA